MTTMTTPSAAFRAGGDEMRERICALIHQHHYALACKYHGSRSEMALLLKNLLHDIREDHGIELEAPDTTTPPQNP